VWWRRNFGRLQNSLLGVGRIRLILIERTAENMKDRMDYLSGKVAVVTGVSKGIGKAVALALLDRAVTVIGWGLTTPDFEDEKLHFIACDVSDADAVDAALVKTLSIANSIDFIINNAGFGYFAPIETFDIVKFKRMLDVNVTGAFLVTRALVPTLKIKQAGHIVNVSSIAGKVGMAQGEGYNASKFAVAGMTDCLFQELRKDGIKVTTVFPGSTATHFFDAIPGFSAHDKMLDADELARSIVHVLDTSPNYLIREIEIRPLTSK
jgi:NAD(P)-dependent dehydrogenase (short-subunit alcohol dehydrogenase family)